MGDFNFGWSEFDTNAPETFKQLWEDKDFVNVTLATMDDVSINAHKIILSSASPLFRRILLQNPHTNPLLYFHNIKSTELRLILKFIYFGQCKVGQGDLINFLAAGRELDINGLTEHDNARQGGSQEGSNRTEQTEQKDVKTELTDELDPPPTITPFLSANKTAEEELLEHELTTAQPAMDEEEENIKSSFDPSKEIEATKTVAKREHVKRAERKEFEFGVYTLMGRGSMEYNGKHYVKNGADFYRCHECHFEHMRPNGIAFHVAVKHEGKKLSCKECDFKFIVKANLKDHILTVHNGVKFACNYCNVEFPSRPACSTHRVHGNCGHPSNTKNNDKKINKRTLKKIKQKQPRVTKSDETLKCSQCDFVTKESTHIEAHKLYVHSGATFLCDKCDFQGAQPLILKTHMERKHPGTPMPLNLTMILPKNDDLLEDQNYSGDIPVVNNSS
jgi:hypothetical protein